MANTPRLAASNPQKVQAAKPQPTNSKPQPVPFKKAPRGYMPPRTNSVPR